MGCSSLTDIAIPNSVTSIGSCAFSNCIGLTNITIPNSVTNIGEKAFTGCDGLTHIIIPTSVTCIESATFYWCMGLTSVTIPNSVTNIGSSAFCGCIGLTNVTIPNSVKAIGQRAFEYCNNLDELTCLAMEPPTLDSSVFGYTKCSEGTLYVPEGAIDTYKATDQWNIWGTIVGIKVATAITLNKNAATIYVGETENLTATITPDDAANKSVTWVSSNTEVATVDDDGVVTAVAAGTAIITVTAADGSGVSATCSITVAPAIIDGDANSDNEVDVSDVALTVEYILGHSLNNFVFAAADLDKDNTIDVADVALMVNIIMYGSVSSPISASKMITEQERTPYLYVTSGDQTLNLWLANADNLVSAMQFDLALPQGVELRDVLPSSFMTQHSVSSSLMDNGMTRVLCISLNNSLMSPDEHGIMAVSLSENIEQLRDLYLKNIIISTPDGAKKHLKDVAVASTTDMKLLTVGQQGKDIYSLNGQKRQSAQKGLNIIKTSDGSYKKILITKNK